MIGAQGQALELRFYSNAPKGLNFLLGGYTLSTGGLSVDPSFNLEDANIDLHMALAGYARSGALFGEVIVSAPHIVEFISTGSWGGQHGSFELGGKRRLRREFWELHNI